MKKSRTKRSAQGDIEQVVRNLREVVNSSAEQVEPDGDNLSRLDYLWFLADQVKDAPTFDEFLRSGAGIPYARRELRHLRRELDQLLRFVEQAQGRK